MPLTNQKCKQIADNLKKNFPDDGFAVLNDKVFTSDFTGAFIFDFAGLRIFKITRSKKVLSQSNDQFKQKCFKYVSQTISITDLSQRRKILKQNISKMFPDMNVFVILGQASFPWSLRNHQNYCQFTKSQNYGCNILIVLN